MLSPFALRRIQGRSMLEVLDEGDFVLIRRLGLKSPIKVGDVIEISHPRLGNIVKRVLDCDETHIWVKGDAFNSIAPSDIGPVSRATVVAKALWRISPRGIRRI
jgi:signal peptidase I